MTIPNTQAPSKPTRPRRKTASSEELNMFAKRRQEKLEAKDERERKLIEKKFGSTEAHEESILATVQQFSSPARSILGYASELITASASDDGLRTTPEFTKYKHDHLSFIQQILESNLTFDVCKAVRSSQTHKITLLRSGTSTGKSHAMARIAIANFLIYSESGVYCTAAPPVKNLNDILWAQIESVIQQYPRLFPSRIFDIKLSSMTIKRKANPLSLLTGLSIPVQGTDYDRESKFSGKHPPKLVFIADECNAIPVPVFKGMDGCMSNDSDRFVGSFNPRPGEHVPAQWEKSGRANVIVLSELTHPNVIYGVNRIPGAVDRETVVRRINMWTRPAQEGEGLKSQIFTPPKYLIGATAKMDGDSRDNYPPLTGVPRLITEPEFYYMVLGEYPAMSAGHLIPLELIENAKARWLQYVSTRGETPPHGVTPVAGFDVAESIDFCVLTLRYGGFVAKQMWWRGSDVIASTNRVLSVLINTNAYVCNVDATGVGAGAVPHLHQSGYRSAVAIKVANSVPKVFKQRPTDAHCERLRDLMLWRVREWLRTDPSAMLPPCPLLTEELSALEYTYDQQNRVKITNAKELKERLRRSPDRLTSLALTHAPWQRADASVRQDSYI